MLLCGKYMTCIYMKLRVCDFNELRIYEQEITLADVLRKQSNTSRVPSDLSTEMDKHLQGQCEQHALLTGIAYVMHYRGQDTSAAHGSQLNGSRLL